MVGKMQVHALHESAFLLSTPDNSSKGGPCIVIHIQKAFSFPRCLTDLAI